MATATIQATSGAQILNEQHFLIDSNATPAELLARAKAAPRQINSMLVFCIH